ncbi:ABC transporter ATP-binding protein [Halovenus sp. HT40]|uniref:ABC transporter ATP-binding protein n=1 Tax=Halovenus sp. HT40 TaxID=3126691 RepID=UPI00300F159B
MTLLEVSDLTVKFYTPDGVVRAVDELSYQIDRGERFGVVGESGAGKSVSALSLLRLIENPGQIESGAIRFYDEETVSALESDFSNHVVDLEDLRQTTDKREIAESLTEEEVSAEELTGDPQYAGDDPTDVPTNAFEIQDILELGYGDDVGLIGEHDFIVHDGDESYVELLRAPKKAIQRIRGNRIAMVFQDAQTALNPVYSVGDQISEAIRHHMDLTDKEAKERTIELLDRVGIPDAETRYSDYPHEFSGGMQQRVVIAMALSCDPDILVADEPTTALDVMTEAKILGELEELSDEFGTSIQLITHDLGVIAELCERVVVMYAGKPVEKAPVDDLFYDPKHPYTVGLMASIPRIGTGVERLKTIPGTMPDLIEVPSGCSFHPRCPYAEESCTRKEPVLVDPETGEPTGPEDERGASCLEYTGDLTQSLSFDVRVENARGDNRISGDSSE